jgi:two-component system response regulator FixJ
MPEVSGIDLLRRVKESGIHMPVIVVTGHGDIQLAVEAMKIGAADFFEKPFDDELLLGAIKSALTQRKLESQRDSERGELMERLQSLSQREREVLEGLVAGNPNKVIASDLGISPRTVEIYRANVMTKMKAASLSELVRLALACGLLDAHVR